MFEATTRGVENGELLQPRRTYLVRFRAFCTLQLIHGLDLDTRRIVHLQRTTSSTVSLHEVCQ
jgi:hypothetical protein